MTTQRFFTISVLTLLLIIALVYFCKKGPQQTVSSTIIIHTPQQNMLSYTTTTDALPPTASKTVTQTPKSAAVENEKLNRALLYAKSREIHTTKRNTASVQLQSSAFISHVFQDGRWQLTSLKSIAKNDPASQRAVAEVDQWALIENSENYDFKNFDKNSPAAVYDSRLKKIGLITGTLKIITDQPESLSAVLRSHAAAVTQSFPQIQTYFVTSNSSVFNLESLYSDLKAQSSVRSIELEILDRQYERN